MTREPIPAGFNLAYKIAANISDAFEPKYGMEKVQEYFWFFAIDPEQYFVELIQENPTKIMGPEKSTLLHVLALDFLHAYQTHKIYWFFDDYYNWDKDDIIEFFEKNFISVFSHYDAISSQDRVFIDGFYEEIRGWESIQNLKSEEKENLTFFCYDFLNSFLDKVDELIANEIFFLLFLNKRFLFSFSKIIAEYTGQLQKDTLFKVFKRPNNLPEWMKRAIKFRDKSSCQRCHKDLSGNQSILLDNEMHFDHIIPLEKGGSNDPTNFQILCQKCNLNKGIKFLIPKHSFINFWES